MPLLADLPDAMRAKIDAVKAWRPPDAMSGPAIGEPYRFAMEWPAYPIADFINWRMYYPGFVVVVTYLNVGVEAVKVVMDRNNVHRMSIQAL